MSKRKTNEKEEKTFFFVARNNERKMFGREKRNYKFMHDNRHSRKYKMKGRLDGLEGGLGLPFRRSSRRSTSASQCYSAPSAS